SSRGGAQLVADRRALGLLGPRPPEPGASGGRGRRPERVPRARAAASEPPPARERRVSADSYKPPSSPVGQNGDMIHESFIYLRVQGAAAAIAFYEKVFDAEELFRLT